MKSNSMVFVTLVLMLAGCGQPGKTASDINSASPTTPPGQKAAMPNKPKRTLLTLAPSYASGGLGLSRAEWERRHGSPEQEIGGFFNYSKAKYAVMFLDGNVSHIEYTWEDGGAVTLTEARSFVKSLMPRDAKRIRKYISQSGRPVDLYMSASLKSRFNAVEMPDGAKLSPWTGGKPGNFIILYRLPSGDNRVTSLVAAIGNNP